MLPPSPHPTPPHPTPPHPTPPTRPQVWDLHVGASLDVLGKPVTLLKADLGTAAWIERHAK